MLKPALAALMMAVVALGCPDKKRDCVPGATQRCHCATEVNVSLEVGRVRAGAKAALRGVQSCTPDGRSWSSCRCPKAARQGSVQTATPEPVGGLPSAKPLPSPPVPTPSIAPNGRTPSSPPVPKIGPPPIDPNTGKPMTIEKMKKLGMID